MLPRRAWFSIAIALASLLALAFVVQAFNQLIWQLSYWLPGWLIGPLLLLLLALVVLAVGLLLPVIYLTWSLKYGRKASGNPWNARGLEWQMAGSPPITTNFAGPIIVEQEAYDFEHGPIDDSWDDTPTPAGGKA